MRHRWWFIGGNSYECTKCGCIKKGRIYPTYTTVEKNISFGKAPECKILNEGKKRPTQEGE